MPTTGKRPDPPKLVLLDVGNVLISLRRVRDVFPFGESKGWSQATDGEIDHGILEFLRSETVDRFERGLSAPDEFFRALRTAFRTELPEAELEARFRRILGPEVPGMRELVIDLKRRGIRVAGLSDTNPVHLETIQGYAVIRELEALVASSDTGLRKPAEAAFREALRRLSVPPGEVFYTDDLPPNVDGARRTGMRAVVFEGADRLRAELGI